MWDHHPFSFPLVQNININKYANYTIDVSVLFSTRNIIWKMNVESWGSHSFFFSVSFLYEAQFFLFSPLCGHAETGHKDFPLHMVSVAFLQKRTIFMCNGSVITAGAFGLQPFYKTDFQEPSAFFNSTH